MAQKRARSVKIKKYSLVDAKLEKRFKAWKLFVCKLIGIPVLHRYNFIYSVDYFAGKLHKEDVVVDQRGVSFMVVSESNSMAIIVSHEPKSEQPKMHGILYIVEDPKKKEKDAELKVVK